MMTIQQTKKNVLICGGYGFLGSAIVRALLQSPDYVIYIVDKLAPGVARSSVQKNVRVKFLNFEIQQFSAYAALLPAKVDYLVHCASSVPNPGVTHSCQFQLNIVQPELDLPAALAHEAEILNTISTLVELHHVEKALFLSSSLVNTDSTFSSYHQQMDALLKTHVHLPYLIAQLPAQFGIFQNSSQFIPGIMLQLLARQPVVITEYPETFYKWAYVDDTAAYLRQLLTAGLIQQTYSIPGTRLTIGDICRKLEALTDGGESQITFQPTSQKRNNQPLNSAECVSPIHFTESIEERLALTYEFYEDNYHYYVRHFNDYIGRDKR